MRHDRRPNAFTLVELPAVSERKRAAFTLVELLVVIGIISVLISVLLPSLNRARQAGNLVDCQARLQQMGQALQIYAAQNKGVLPWGGVNRTDVATWTDPATRYTNTPANREQFWWWFYTLSEISDRLSPSPDDGLFHGISRMFRDRDTVDAPQEPRWVMHYTANPRVLYRADVPDTAPTFLSPAQAEIQPQDLTPRKITSVRRSSDVFVIWDAPQLVDQAYNAYGFAEAMDGWGWYNSTGFCYDTNATAAKVDRPVHPGRIGSAFVSGKVSQKRYNFDAPNAFLPNGWLSHLRFRHMNNTRLAALCLDGHVETREPGSVVVKDIFTNYR